jgi:hypothetical protein
MITSFHQFLERKMQNVYDLERSLTKHRDDEGEHFHVDGKKPARNLRHRRVSSEEDVLKTLLKGKDLKVEE